MKTYEVVVAVANIWTAASSARKNDEFALSNPVQLNKWLEQQPYKERLALCDSNLLQSQLLYGECLQVIEEVDGWSSVIVSQQPSRKNAAGYPGWVPSHQLQIAQEKTATKFVIVTANKTQIYKKDFTLSIVVPFNTIVDYLDEDAIYYDVQTPHGAAKILKSDAAITALPHVGNRDSMANRTMSSLQFLDLPYVWGGMSSYGYDCSGFTYNIAKAAGHIIGRDATEQSEGGTAINKDDRTQWRVGDLLFFADDLGTKKESIRHVGLYFGNDLLLHSHQTGKSVELYELNGSTLEKEICAVRRYD